MRLSSGVAGFVGIVDFTGNDLGGLGSFAMACDRVPGQCARTVVDIQSVELAEFGLEAQIFPCAIQAVGTSVQAPQVQATSL